MRFIKNIFKGWFGEVKTSFNMWVSLDSDIYVRFHDLIIPSSNGTAQIDHVLISQYGIFIVETKNKTGWIFGSEENPKWTQSVFGKKFSFQNPLRQTFRQKKVLAQFLDVQESQIHPIVYFVGDCSFRTTLPQNVLKSGLSNYIKRFEVPIFSLYQQTEFVRKLELLRIESNISSSDHIRSLQIRHSSKSNCPNCGSILRIKEAKQGPTAGTKFLGCTAYPRCRFTRAA